MVNQSFIGFSLSVGVTLFLPPQPVLVKNSGMRLVHYGIAWKPLTGTTAGNTLLQNVVAGVAVANIMFFHTALTAALYVGWARATVKSAVAQLFLIHDLTASFLVLELFFTQIKIATTGNTPSSKISWVT